MNTKRFRQDVERRKVSIEDLVELVLGLDREVRHLRAELDRTKQRLAKYEPEVLNPPGKPVENKAESDRPESSAKYSLEAEERRRGEQRPRAKSPGRTPTTVKFEQADRTENLYPQNVRPQACTPSSQRVVWRVEAGQGTRVGYQLHVGPKGEQTEVPGVLSRGEFDLRIVVAVAYLTYIMRLSLDQVCELMQVFWQIPLQKSQADAILNQLARHWAREFNHLHDLLALATVVGTDETGWKISDQASNATVFTSPGHVLMLFGIPKGKETLHKVLPPGKFRGVVLSDDHSTYRGLALGQKCWAHLLRKAIQLAVLYPEHALYREFLDGLLAIYRDANRRRMDKRLDEDGRKRLANEFSQRLRDLCHPYVWTESRNFRTAHAKEHHLLASELFRLCEFGELFTFVEDPEVPGTNNCSEQQLRGPAQSRKVNRTSRSDWGALRRSICTSVLESLRKSLPVWNLTTVTNAVAEWIKTGTSLFAQQLAELRDKLTKKPQLALDTG